jgi:Domain of unknown function (DUF3127)
MVIEGKLHTKFDTQQVSDSFKKRDFVLEIAENPLYPQYVTFQLVQDRCDNIDKFKVGDKLEVVFNLRGREYTKDNEKRYFNTLEAWMIKEASASGATQAATVQVGTVGLPADNSDDLPF